MKIVLSGIKPTGIPTLGNYLGALKNFVKLQNEIKEDEFFIFVADLHALTVPQDPKELRSHIRNLCALYLAVGLNPENLTLFIQSEVKEHVELGYLMQSLVYMGELERMTQYKDKKQKQVEGVSSALFTYPALMAADILLYDATYVPVGRDQMQHLELARTLAERFNHRFGDTFIVPQGIEPKQGTKITDLQNPTKKMDKSAENDKGCIYLLEDLNKIKKKIKSAVTDLDGCIRFDKENKPGISNLMTIYAAMSGMEIKEIESKYQGCGYKEFKEDVANIVVQEIEGIQKKYQEWIHSPQLDELLDQGREKAQHVACKKMEVIRQKMGYGR